MRVPRYDQPQVGVSQVASINTEVKTSLETFGGGAANIGTAVADSASKIGQLIKQEQDKANKIKLDELESKIVEWETTNIYGENGAVSKKGKNAFEQVDVVNQNYTKLTEELSKDLNEDQKTQFKQIAENRRLSIDRTVQRHVGVERVRYDNEVAESLINNEANAAALAFEDPDRVSLSINRQKEALERLGKNNGWSPEEMQAKTTTVVSKTHSGVIDMMLSKDRDMDAEKYFNANKDQFSSDDLQVVSKKIEDGSLRGKSQRLVDIALDRGLSESAAIERARKVEDPKLRDALYDRIKMEYGLRDSARRNDIERTHRSVLNLIDQGKITDLTKAPGWSSMDVGQRTSLQNYAKKEAKGESIKTDLQTYYDLRTKASDPITRDAFLKENLMIYRDKLDKGDFEEIVKLQADARSKKPEATKKLQGFLTDSQIAKQTYEAAGGKVTNKEDWAQYNNMLNQAKIRHQEKTGKEMTDSEFTQMANNLTKEYVLNEGFLWDTKKKAFKITQEDLDKVEYGDIPKKERLEIENILRSNKRVVTPEAVRQLYIKGIQSGK